MVVTRSLSRLLHSSQPLTAQSPAIEPWQPEALRTSPDDPVAEDSRRLASPRARAADAAVAATAPLAQTGSSFDDGFQQGFEQGLAQGFGVGLNDGRRQGLEEGRLQGRQEGLRLGREEGLQAGRVEGRQEAAAAAHHLITQAEDLLGSASQEAERLLRALATETATLATLMAERILRQQLQLQPERLVSMVAVLLEEIDAHGGVRILASSADAALLQAEIEELTQRAPLADIDVIPLRHVADGQLRIETDGGDYDASVTTQLANLKRQVEQALAGTPPADLGESEVALHA